MSPEEAVGFELPEDDKPAEVEAPADDGTLVIKEDAPPEEAKADETVSPEEEAMNKELEEISKKDHEFLDKTVTAIKDSIDKFSDDLENGKIEHYKKKEHV